MDGRAYDSLTPDLKRLVRGRQTKYHVLGPLLVLDEGRPVALGSGRRPLLLACLLVHAGESVSRDLLIDALWAERPPASAANALQVQVHALRKLLGQERILTEGPGYRLRIEPGELDREVFEELLARGREQLARGDAAGAAATLDGALALWRGPALVDVAYEPFAQAEIARLEELRVVASEERIDARLALAEHLELVPELESLVAAHPSRERLHGQLMLALYRSGRQAEALAVYRRARATLREELGLEPGPELKQLQQAILRHDARLRVEQPDLGSRRHLPAPQTPLVGRTRELEEVGGLVRGTVRLVTLTGPGGTGKTRLALRAAHDLADVFADGVYFVDLSRLREPALVSTTIAHALGLDEQRDQPTAETIQTYLTGRQLLLVLDNFEVVDEAAPLLADLLNASPGLSLVVTSRTPLRLSAEHELRVSSLPLADAVQLFAARARAVAPGFRRPSEEADEVSELCRRLDCLPLAIELAAARTRDYAPAELLELLPRGLDLASEGARDLPERQRTLRDTIDWSHRLLACEDRVLFARLSVFAGGCTVAAAEAVCDTGRAALASLVAKSLLVERLGRDGEPRFFMLETVREYALESLAVGGETERLRRRHAEYFADFAEASEREVIAPEKWFNALDDELDNLRAALVWSGGTGAVELELRIAGALPRFLLVRGHMREGRMRIERALENGTNAPVHLRAKALWGAARIRQVLGDYERMHEFAEESVSLYRSIGDRRWTAWALDRLASAAANLGDFGRGRALYEEATAIFRELDDELGVAVALNNLSCICLMENEAEEGAEFAAESLAICRKLGRRYGMVPPIGNLGVAALLRHRYDEAVDLFRQGVELGHEHQYFEGLVCCLVGLAAVRAETDEAGEAATLLGIMSAVVGTSGLALEPLERGLYDRTMETLTSALGEDALAVAVATGKQLMREDGVAYALGRAVTAEAWRHEAVGT